MPTSFEQDVAAIGSIKAIPTILDIVCRSTGMRFAAVARVTEKRWIACSVHDEIAFGLLPGGELKLETTICHEIRQSGEAVVIDHVAEDDVFRGHPTPALYGFQSYISIPIRRTDGTFFGTLCAIDPEPHRLKTPETIAMFEMFADVIGFHLSAIDHLNTVETNLSDERETSALREQFIAVLGHDLRNPLTAIRSGIALLRKTPLNDKANTIVALMQDSVDRMTGLIDNVMDFARGRLGGGLTLERRSDTRLDEVIIQIAAELQAEAPDRVIDLQLDLPRPVDCDPRRIGQMISNLLGNALTYGAPDRPIRLGAAIIDQRLKFFIANEGEPIPPAALDSIFEPFSRGALGPSKQGLGLGLYISSSIAKAHGGTLDVVSNSAETRFSFTMPLSPL